MYDRAWYERRLTGFGGSDAAAVLGISRWQTPRGIVEEKGRRIIPDPDGGERLRFRIGKELEPMLRSHAAEAIAAYTGDKVTVRQSRRLYRGDAFFVIANVDGFAQSPAWPSALVEVKTDVFGYEPWGRPAATSIGETGWKLDPEPEPAIRAVPPTYFAQVQHSLVATRREVGFVLVLIGLSEERLYVIERDEDFIADMLELERDAWARVQQIRSRLAADADAAIDDLLPAIDGSAASEEWLRKRFPADDGVVIPATAEQEIVLKRLQGIVRRKKELEQEEALAKNEVREMIGERAGITSELGTVTHKLSKGSTEIAWQSIASAYRTLIEAVRNAHTRRDNQAERTIAGRQLHDTDLDALAALHTGTKEGSRRLILPRAWTAAE